MSKCVGRSAEDPCPWSARWAVRLCIGGGPITLACATHLAWVCTLTAGSREASLDVWQVKNEGDR